MAELSVDDAQRLARLFLTGQATEGDIQRLQSAVADDQGAALELLAQMQAALDDSAPAGLTGEQDRSVNSRIEALVAPRVKKRGPFSFLFKLFRRQPKPAEEAKPTRLRRRGAAAEPETTPEAAAAPAEISASVGEDLGETLPGGGMEEMAPIAAAPVVPNAAPEVSAVPEKPAPSGASTRRRAIKNQAIAAGIAALALVAAGFYAWNWFSHRKPQSRPAPIVAQAPKPTPSPTPAGRARRGVDIAPRDQEPLPAEFKAMTPIASGSSNIND